jgi:DNA gyrase subunit A
VLVFTESGRVYWLKVHRIPSLSPASRGKAIVNLLDLEKHERVATTVAVRDFEEGYLVFATEQGTVKRTELQAYSNPRAGGIIAINVDEDDRLLDVRLSEGEHEIFLATVKGIGIRFSESDIRVMGRATRGVRGINLRDGDRVVSMTALEGDGDIMTITSGGYGKRTRLEEYRTQSRGGYGIINIKVGEKIGEVVGARQVIDGDGMMLITQAGKLIRINVDGVRQIGRATQGVKVMDLGSEDRLVAIAKIVDREDEEGEESDEPAGAVEEAEGTEPADEPTAEADPESIN